MKVAQPGNFTFTERNEDLRQSKTEGGRQKKSEGAKRKSPGFQSTVAVYNELLLTKIFGGQSQNSVVYVDENQPI